MLREREKFIETESSINTKQAHSLSSTSKVGLSISQLLSLKIMPRMSGVNKLTITITWQLTVTCISLYNSL